MAALIEATRQLLARDGYRATTTNAIAERAGVSIGSLYEYFANKEDLIHAVLRQLSEVGRTTVAAAAQASVALPLRAALKGILAAYVEHVRLAQCVARELLEHVPFPEADDGLPDADDLIASFLHLIHGFVVARAHEVRSVDPTVAARFVYRAVDGVILDVLRNQPELLDDPTLVDELTHLVAGYLED